MCGEMEQNIKQLVEYASPKTKKHFLTNNYNNLQDSLKLLTNQQEVNDNFKSKILESDADNSAIGSFDHTGNGANLTVSSLYRGVAIQPVFIVPFSFSTDCKSCTCFSNDCIRMFNCCISFGLNML
eukprot:223688_1